MHEVMVLHNNLCLTDSWNLAITYAIQTNIFFKIIQIFNEME